MKLTRRPRDDFESARELSAMNSKPAATIDQSAMTA
jgi:hypothetical protein